MSIWEVTKKIFFRSFLAVVLSLSPSLKVLVILTTGWKISEKFHWITQHEDVCSNGMSGEKNDMHQITCIYTLLWLHTIKGEQRFYTYNYMRYT